jgi:GST-like protein
MSVRMTIPESESGGGFAKVNRPIAGATHDEELPVGERPLQLCSLFYWRKA